MAQASEFDPSKLHNGSLFDTLNSSEDKQDFALDDDRLQQLHHLHRTLSDEIIDVQRSLMRLNAQGKGDSEEAILLREKNESLFSQRTAVEQDIAAETNEHRSLAHRHSEHIDHKGLLKVRHNNRDFFLADMFDYALKDDGVSMEAPIFTLSTKPDLSVWEWSSKDGSKNVNVTPSVLGRATQFDKDVLIYVVSQLTEALNRSRDDAQNRTVRFTVYDYLVTTNRGTGGDDYRRLQESFERLRGTSIKTDIKTGGQRIKEGFGLIDSWRIVEKSSDSKRMMAVEITLSRWLYNAVQAYEVLTLHKDYFRLRKPLARRLYELARKHCGRQTQWSINLKLLQEKCGSKSSIKEFRRSIREIGQANGLLEYKLSLSSEDLVTFYAADGQRLLRGLAAKMPLRKDEAIP